MIKIKKTMGWCDDINSNNYNKIIKVTKKLITKNYLERIKSMIY